MLPFSGLTVPGAAVETDDDAPESTGIPFSSLKIYNKIFCYHKNNVRKFVSFDLPSFLDEWIHHFYSSL